MYPSVGYIETLATSQPASATQKAALRAALPDSLSVGGTSLSGIFACSFAKKSGMSGVSSSADASAGAFSASGSATDAASGSAAGSSGAGADAGSVSSGTALSVSSLMVGCVRAALRVSVDAKKKGPSLAVSPEALEKPDREARRKDVRIHAPCQLAVSIVELSRFRVIDGLQRSKSDGT